MAIVRRKPRSDGSSEQISALDAILEQEAALPVDPAAIGTIPEQLVVYWSAVPVAIDAERVVVASAHPDDPAMRKSLAHAVAPRSADFVIADQALIDRHLESTYGALGRIQLQVEGFPTAGRSGDPGPGGQEDQPAVESSVSKITDSVLLEATVSRASDVHFEPHSTGTVVRFRIDGVMREVLRLPAVFGQAVVRRIKVLAGMNLVDHRHAQDGQFNRSLRDEQVDFRVSTAPTVTGENAVLRLFRNAQPLAMDNLGMPPEMVVRARVLLSQPFGLVLSAGPTGHGKTSTLYAMLASIDTAERNVVTIEDPVEHRFDEITQINVDEQSDTTFTSGLRAIMRQDPDVILVGEIRDIETARMAARAAITGHLVMSSIHSTDAASALHRLLEMEIEPYEIAASLTAVIAQRLVRQVCPVCARPYEPTGEELELYRSWGGVATAHFLVGDGCPNCVGTGFFGRTGVFEYMELTEEMFELVYRRAPASRMRMLAAGQGMRTMWQHAADLVARGGTTIAEAHFKLGGGMPATPS